MTAVQEGGPGGARRPGRARRPSVRPRWRCAPDAGSSGSGRQARTRARPPAAPARRTRSDHIAPRPEGRRSPALCRASCFRGGHPHRSAIGSSARSSASMSSGARRRRRRCSGGTRRRGRGPRARGGGPAPRRGGSGGSGSCRARRSAAARASGSRRAARRGAVGLRERQTGFAQQLEKPALELAERDVDVSAQDPRGASRRPGCSGAAPAPPRPSPASCGGGRRPRGRRVRGRRWAATAARSTSVRATVVTGIPRQVVASRVEAT